MTGRHTPPERHTIEGAERLRKRRESILTTIHEAADAISQQRDVWKHIAVPHSKVAELVGVFRESEKKARETPFHLPIALDIVDALVRIPEGSPDAYSPEFVSAWKGEVWHRLSPQKQRVEMVEENLPWRTSHDIARALSRAAQQTSKEWEEELGIMGLAQKLLPPHTTAFSAADITTVAGSIGDNGIERYKRGEKGKGLIHEYDFHYQQAIAKRIIQQFIELNYGNTDEETKRMKAKLEDDWTTNAEEALLSSDATHQQET